jgi:hypothetical protein
MGVRNRTADLEENPEHLVKIERLTIDIDRLTFDILHHKVWLAIRAPARIEQVGDIGVRERRKDAPFLDKTLVVARKLQVRLKQFHRYMLVNFAIDAVREPD